MTENSNVEAGQTPRSMAYGMTPWPDCLQNGLSDEQTNAVAALLKGWFDLAKDLEANAQSAAREGELNKEVSRLNEQIGLLIVAAEDYSSQDNEYFSFKEHATLVRENFHKYKRGMEAAERTIELLRERLAKYEVEK